MLAPHQPEREISAFSFFRSHIYSQHLFKWKAFEQKKKKKKRKEMGKNKWNNIRKKNNNKTCANNMVMGVGPPVHKGA